MRNRKLFIPIIALLIILGAISYPLASYVKGYSNSKKLYDKALATYNSKGVERHTEALILLDKITDILDVVKIESLSVYVSVNNPYRALRNELRYAVKEDYKIFYVNYLNEKYSNTIVAYLSELTELNFATIGGDFKEVIDLSYLNDGRGFESLKWSPDGRFIVLDDRNYLYLYDVMRKKARVLTGNESSWSYYPSWSSDSSEVLFINSKGRGEVRAININDGSQRLIKTSEQAQNLISYPLFFDNDKKIIFSNSSNSFEIIDLDGNLLFQFDIPHDSVVLTQREGLKSNHELKYMSISNDGKYLIFKKGNTKILNMNSKKVSTFLGDTYHSWSPDNKAVMFMDYEDDIYLVPINQYKALPSLKILNGTSPAWSPILSEEVLVTFE